MRLPLFLSAPASFLVAAFSVAGCSDGQEACTLDYRYHSIEVARDLTTTSNEVDVEACLEDECKTATSAADGTFSFGSTLGEVGPADGKIEPASSGARRITVRFSVGEQAAGATSTFVVRVREGEETRLEETASVRWSDEDCHPVPTSTNL